MQIQITDTITEDDQNALLAGLRAYNRQFLRTTNFGDLAVYAAQRRLRHKIDAGCRADSA